jgi:predicted  nucleic acid-binding Zn-ribbon protein
MSFWTKVKKDLQKGVDEGLAFVKEGAAVVMRKAEELTDEGKKRYILYEMKAKVQKEIAELGGHVYDLSAQMRNPMLDSKVKDITARIRRLEAEIQKLEGKQTAAKPAVAKKTSARKPAVRKTPSKKTATQKARVIPASTTD